MEERTVERLIGGVRTTRVVRRIAAGASRSIAAGRSCLRWGRRDDLAASPAPGSRGERQRATGDRPGVDRGVSDVVALAILVGMVVTGAVLVAATGGQVIEDTRDRSESAAAVAALQSMDAALSSLAHGGTSDRTRLAVGTDDPDEFRIDRGGSIEVAVDGGTCRASVPLTSIRYRTDGGATLTYEAGGIWRTDPGGTTTVTPPDLAYRNRTIQLSVLNLSGDVRRSRVPARVLDSSRSDGRSIEERLTGAPGCVRPDDVTITVRSDRYRAWGRYMAEEFGLAVGRGVSVDPANRTASVTVPQRMLPRAADDDRNRVVDFVDGYGRLGPGTVSVDKGASSLSYPVAITVLGGHEQGARPTVTVHRDRRPLDVAFVIDESGSMAGGKLADTRSATRGFVDRLNATADDRVGLVGYSDTGPCYFWNPCPPNYRSNARVHLGLSGDLDAAANRVDTDLRADGGTPIAAGLDRTTAHFAADGREGSERVAVLLSDGKHNGDGNVTAAAERAASRNVTVYAVGFGDDADASTLSSIANATGGAYYHADDASELRDRFETIAVEVSKTRSVRPTPVTVRAGSATLLPNGTARDVPADGTDHDLKDPELDGPLAYSTDLRDGRRLSLTLTSWDCERWTPTNESVEGPDGHQYRDARCVAATAANTTVDASSSPDRVRAFTAANTTADLPDGTGSWVESNVTEVLRENDLVDQSGTLALESDQAVFVYDLPEGAAGTGDYNDQVVLVEVGHSTDEVRVGYAVSVTVSDVRLGSDL